MKIVLKYSPQQVIIGKEIVTYHLILFNATAIIKISKKTHTIETLHEMSRLQEHGLN